MKITKSLQSLLFSGLVGVLLLASCQGEENEVVTPNTETLSKNAPLTQLLQRVTASSTSFDNVIDSTDCFQVQLPVEVIANDVPVLVGSEEDYLEVEEVFDASPYDDDSVTFVFPITVVYADYTEEVIETQEEFDAITEDCFQDAVPGDDETPIDCLEISYPITVFVYDANFQAAETEVIESDEEFYAFLAGLDPNEYYALDFPFSFVDLEGETSAVYNNAECETAIEVAVSDCVEEVVSCIADSTPFTSVFESALNVEGVQETTIWSAVTHEYTFSLDTDGVICTIGYQADMNGGEYILEILEEDGTVLYSGMHDFEADELNYVSITPVTVTANQKYIIKRSRPDAIGGGLCKAAMKVEGLEPLLPLTSDGLTIYSTRYYGGGTGSEEQVYHLVPFISFGFSAN